MSVSSFIFSFFCLLGFYFNRKNHYLIVAITVTILSILLLFYSFADGVSLQDSGIALLPVIIIFSSFLLGKKTIPYVFSILISGLILIVIFERTGLIEPPVETSIARLAAANAWCRSEFDDIATKLLADLATCSGKEIDNLIEKILKEVGSFTGSEIAFLIQIAADGKTWSSSHEWCAEGSVSIKKNFQNIPLGALGWAENILISKGDNLVINSLRDLPPQASALKQMYNASGIQSIVQVPLRASEKLTVGILGLLNLSREVVWCQTDKRILIVDDQDENRSYLNDLLTTTGFTIRIASDGIEAVTIFEEWSPDLILMDLKMPNMDGFEATRRTKSRKGGLSTKIIIVSASAYDIDKAQIAKLDVDGFIRKPFKEKELFQKIGRCLDIDYIYEDATKNAQIDKLKELIAECRDLSPEFAEKLVSLANRYEYEALLKLLEQGD